MGWYSFGYQKADPDPKAKMRADRRYRKLKRRRQVGIDGPDREPRFVGRSEPE